MFKKVCDDPSFYAHNVLQEAYHRNTRDPRKTRAKIAKLIEECRGD